MKFRVKKQADFISSGNTPVIGLIQMEITIFSLQRHLAYFIIE